MPLAAQPQKPRTHRARGARLKGDSRLVTLIGCSALALGACGNAGPADQTGQTAQAANAGETRSGPMGGGDNALQTTLADPAPLGTLALTVETLADGLETPWCIAFLPDGDMLVTERPGRIRIIRNGVLLDAPVAGAPEPLVWNQSGYFDILVHPDFSENRVVFLAYAHGDKQANALRVVKARLIDDALSDIETLYEAKPLKDTGHHYGGKLVLGGDGMLYFTIGEGSRYKEKAQDMASSFGAVVRIDQDGTPPDDNPTFGDGERPELFTKGHRNPQGLAYDPETGVLWSHEHGARGGDEINIIERGANYGWPLATYGIDYNGARISPFTEYQGTKQPFKYWTPSIAPSGLAVYRGALFPDWSGDLLVGALAGRALHRIDLENGQEIGETRYLTELDERIRDVRVGPDGAVYVATEGDGEGADGEILRLTPAGE